MFSRNAISSSESRTILKWHLLQVKETISSRCYVLRCTHSYVISSLSNQKPRIVMQLALGRKTGSANHPVCLLVLFFFQGRACLFAGGKGALLAKIKGRKPRIRRGMTSASTRSSYICTRLGPDSGEQPSSSSSSSSSSPFSGIHFCGEVPPEKWICSRVREYYFIKFTIPCPCIIYPSLPTTATSSADSSQVFHGNMKPDLASRWNIS